MTGIFPPQNSAAGNHLLQNVSVTHIRYNVFDPHAFERNAKSEITHNRADQFIVFQTAGFEHKFSADGKNLIAGNRLALFIDRNDPVAITVKCKSCGSARFNDPFR